MSLEQIIEELKTKATPKGEVVEVEIPNSDPTRPLTENDLPTGMSLTNRLDRMTRDQAIWAIANGGAWIAYLREQRESGVDVDIVESTAKPAFDPPTPAEIYETICDILDKAWLDMTDNMLRASLRAEQKSEWVELLQWAIKTIPDGYERQREIFQDELAAYHTPLTKPEK